MKLKYLLLVFLLGLSFTVYAEDNEKITIEKPRCTQPEVTQSNREVTAENKQQIEEYKTCMHTYIKEHNNKSRRLNKEAQAESDAANAAIQEWNTFATASAGSTENQEKQ